MEISGNGFGKAGVILEPVFRRRQRLPEFSRNFGCGVRTRHAAGAKIGELVTDGRAAFFRAIDRFHFFRSGFSLGSEFVIVFHEYRGRSEKTFRRKVEIAVFNVDIVPRTAVDEQAQNPQFVNRLLC